jgi:hypothetical protein
MSSTPWIRTLAAMLLIVSVVSFLNRGAIASLAGSLLRRDQGAKGPRDRTSNTTDQAETLDARDAPTLLLFQVVAHGIQWQPANLKSSFSAMAA